MNLGLSLLLLLFPAPQASDSPAAPIVWVYDEVLAGGEIALEGVNTFTFWGTQAVTQGGSGDEFIAEWKHLQDNGYTRNVVVTYERPNGVSQEVANSSFQRLVQIALDFYPPNVPDSLPLLLGDIVFYGGTQLPTEEGSVPGEEVTGLPVTDGTQNDEIMSASWQHDPDGDGPLEPITMTARVEVGVNESNLTAARRLGQMVQAMTTVFPPNVGTPAGPITPGGGG